MGHCGWHGRSSGELASQSLRAALEALAFSADNRLIDKTQRIVAAVQRVHARLQAHGRDYLDGQIIGSTLVALVIEGAEGAVLWAGDSRLYCLRAGILSQLTRDHVPEPVPGVANANQITRAVGASNQLDLEYAYFALAPGDRFLLCSDGLYRELDQAQLQRGALEPELALAGEKLLAAALDRGGRDNISLILVDLT